MCQRASGAGEQGFADTSRGERRDRHTAHLSKKGPPAEGVRRRSLGGHDLVTPRRMGLVAVLNTLYRLWLFCHSPFLSCDAAIAPSLPGGVAEDARESR